MWVCRARWVPSSMPSSRSAGAASPVASKVRAFYEENPFPNYDDVDTAFRLAQKAEAGFFARMLHQEIPPQARVLEVGCGTGQMSNYLGLSGGRSIVGADFCLNSLRLGERFRVRSEIDNVRFIQMDLFHPPFRQGSFDVVICNGVLHHTADARQGFRAIAGLAREGGVLVLGLYNRLGRLPNDLRSALFRLTGRRLLWLDPRLRSPQLGEAKRRAWYKDQYEHPHETRHTMDEVLGWFRGEGVEFLNSLPAPELFHFFSCEEPLFSARPAGNRLERWMVQLGMIFSVESGDGFFVMIGRKGRR